MRSFRNALSIKMPDVYGDVQVNGSVNAKHLPSKKSRFRSTNDSFIPAVRTLRSLDNVRRLLIVNQPGIVSISLNPAFVSSRVQPARESLCGTCGCMTEYYEDVLSGPNSTVPL